MSNKVLAFFNRSQLRSREVVPAEIPSICVCTAPATPTVHESELLPPSEGDIAEGGGDLRVVVTEPVVWTVLFVVESVTIGSAEAIPADVINKVHRATSLSNLFIIPPC